MTKPTLIAHRGVSSLAPENTMAAFIKCLDVGAEWFEFDVSVLADGTVAVMHDETVDRTTNGSGSLAQMTFAQLRKFDAGAWFGSQFRLERVPELVSVVELLNTTKLKAVLEIKPYSKDEQSRHALVSAVAASLEQLKADEKLLICSFSTDILQLCKEMIPQYGRALLVDSATLQADFDKVKQTALNLGCVAIHPEYKRLSAEQVRALQEAGLKVNVWTVDHRDEAEALSAMGVDGLITNRPQDLF